MASDDLRAQNHKPCHLRVTIVGQEVQMDSVLCLLRLGDLDKEQAGSWVAVRRTRAAVPQSPSSSQASAVAHQ